MPGRWGTQGPRGQTSPHFSGVSPRTGGRVGGRGGDKRRPGKKAAMTAVGWSVPRDPGNLGSPRQLSQGLLRGKETGEHGTASEAQQAQLGSSRPKAGAEKLPQLPNGRLLLPFQVGGWFPGTLKHPFQIVMMKIILIRAIIYRTKDSFPVLKKGTEQVTSLLIGPWWDKCSASGLNGG